MPIRKYSPDCEFDPQTINLMVTAFENARTILNVDNPNDPLVEIVAKKVISLASLGCLDPAEIARRVVADTDQPPELA